MFEVVAAVARIAARIVVVEVQEVVEGLVALFNPKLMGMLRAVKNRQTWHPQIQQLAVGIPLLLTHNLRHLRLRGRT